MSEVRKGLGRGLSALLGEPAPFDAPRPAPGPAWIPPTTAPPPSTAANVVELPLGAPLSAPPVVAAAASEEAGPRLLPLNQIAANPNQPRRCFNDAELAELASSIRARGVLQPILVRPLGEGRFEVVAGERRFRAAQAAGLEAIPAVVRALGDAEVLEIAIIENVQRVDLNPIEEALGYQSLIERFGRTQAELAEVVGKSRPHIANTLRLLSLPEDIQALVREGKITAGHARACIGAPDPQGLARVVMEQGLNVREVERLAQKAKEEVLGPRAGGPPKAAAANDDDLAAMQASLAAALGVPVQIARKGEGGEIKLTFKSLAELDDLCRKLTVPNAAAGNF
jgi:ParB family chromosome partitioning protein